VNDFRYKAFISYSHADKGWASWLLRALENYRVPRRLIGRKTDLGIVPARLAPIFRDRDELPAAHRMTDRLFEALRASEFLIVICSPKAVKSRMVNREIEEFKRARGNGHILCVIVDGIPFSANPERECLPKTILHSFRADGTRAGFSPEGLAADLRPDGDGKRMGLTKLIAGMIGVGLNDIVRREEQRRTRRLVGFAAAGLVAMAYMGALTLNAVEARMQARQAQAVAEERRAEVEKQLQANNALLGFMMDDVYVRLLQVGDLKVLEMINTKVQESIEENNLIFASDDHYLRYTGAALRYGQMLDRRGESDAAHEVFQSALKITQSYHAQHPQKVAALFRLQNNLFFTGYLAQRQGRYNEAARDYRKRLDIVDQAYRAKDAIRNDPDLGTWNEERWIRIKADNEMLLGKLMIGPMGKPDRGIALLEKSLEGFKQVVAETSTDAHVTNLGSAYYHLGYGYAWHGQLDRAEEMFLAYKAIYDAFLENDPKNVFSHRRQMNSLLNLALVAAYRGDGQKALMLTEQAAAGYDRLTSHDPANTMWLADSANAYDRLAAAALRRGEAGIAARALETSERQILEALSRDDSRISRQLTRLRIRFSQARLALMQQKPDEAYALTKAAIAAIAALDENFLRADGVLEHVSEAHLLYGQLLTARGEKKAAQAAWNRAVELATRGPAALTLAAKDTLARLYELTGQPDAAQALLNELEEYGYHHHGLPPGA
jgi:tetratricopeptide (TPR) repeat protein